jgi:hypothetical protein
MISPPIRADGSRPNAVLQVLFAAALALGGLSVQAQDAAIVKRATELRDGPSDTAKTLASLPADTTLTRTGERRGPWVQVRPATGANGWIHMFDLAAPPAAAGAGNAATGALRSVTSFFSPSAPKYTTATSTIGIRGLGAEDLAQAQPDLGAVGKMETLRQSERQARDFATQSSLAPVNVEPLAPPVRAGSGAASGNPGSAP